MKQIGDESLKPWKVVNCCRVCFYAKSKRCKCKCGGAGHGKGNSLSSEEIADLVVAEKEFATGKAKTFESAEDLIADLHRGKMEREFCHKEEEE